MPKYVDAFGGLKCPYYFEGVLHMICDIHYKVLEVLFYSEFSKFCKHPN